MTLICDFCDMHPPEFPPTYLATTLENNLEKSRVEIGLPSYLSW